MLALAKSVLGKVYLEDFARNVLRNVRETRKSLSWHSQRKFGRVDRQIMDEYFSRYTVRKLHIGCGSHILEGWLNTNFFPQNSRVFHLDSTKDFPFPAQTFDYIFSEHMIEHVPYSDGTRMLAECYRVLKVNGTIRLSTPDLAFLIHLYTDEKSELQKAYCQWINSQEATDNVVDAETEFLDTFVINNFFRDWGHEFIYDEKILRRSLETAGFSNFRTCTIAKSEDEHLQNLENEKREPEGFLALESIIVEATKLS